MVSCDVSVLLLRTSIHVKTLAEIFAAVLRFWGDFFKFSAEYEVSFINIYFHRERQEEFNVRGFSSVVVEQIYSIKNVNSEKWTEIREHSFGMEFICKSGDWPRQTGTSGKVSALRTFFSIKLSYIQLHKYRLIHSVWKSVSSRQLWFIPFIWKLSYGSIAHFCWKTGVAHCLKSQW